MSPNQQAVVEALNVVGAEYTALENESGWAVEVDSPLSGDDLSSVLRVADTQTNVVVVCVPNVGLAFQTPYWDAGDVVSQGANAAASADGHDATEVPLEDVA